MSDHRLNQGDARGDAARLLHAAARERLKVAVTDLFLPARLRLSEWHRTTMTALLDRLVASIEDDLRAALARSFPARTHEALHAVLSGAQLAVARPILDDGEALRDPALVALLLRRVEEHRLHRAAAAAGPADALLLELVHDGEESVAEAAMAVLVAQNRRLDRFREPLLPSPELPAELEHRLVWSVAGALRIHLIEHHGVSPDAADDALASAASKRLAAHDEGEGLEARSLRLTRLLDGYGRLDDAFIARSLPEAGLSLFLAALAQRCDLPCDAVWEIASEPLGRGLPMLLRSAGLDRAQAGAILVAMAGEDDERLVRRLDLFDSLSIDDARGSLRLWRADPVYRAAAQDPAP